MTEERSEEGGCSAPPLQQLVGAGGRDFVFVSPGLPGVSVFSPPSLYERHDDHPFERSTRTNRPGQRSRALLSPRSARNRQRGSGTAASGFAARLAGNVPRLAPRGARTHSPPSRWLPNLAFLPISIAQPGGLISCCNQSPSEETSLCLDACARIAHHEGQSGCGPSKHRFLTKMSLACFHETMGCARRRDVGARDSRRGNSSRSARGSRGAGEPVEPLGEQVPLCR